MRLRTKNKESSESNPWVHFPFPRAHVLQTNDSHRFSCVGFVARPLELTPGSQAARLVFDPEFSPPSPQLAQTRPDLYAAYNRHAFSRHQRPTIVYVVDDQGRRITTGPLASIQVMAITMLPRNNMAKTPSETAVFSYMSSVPSGLDASLLTLNVLQYDSAGAVNQVATSNLGTVRSPSLLLEFMLFKTLSDFSLLSSDVHRSLLPLGVWSPSPPGCPCCPPSLSPTSPPAPPTPRMSAV